MKRKVENLSDAELEAILGDVSKVDIDVARRNLKEGEVDLEMDVAVNRLLEDLGRETTVDSGDVPDLPPEVKSLFVNSKKETFEKMAKEEAELKGSVYVRSVETSPIAGPKKRDGGLLASIFRPAVISWAICAAAIAIGIFVIKSNNQPGAQGGSVLVASEATVLTPGKLTGFSEPTFTWETNNGGVVFVDVVEAESGKVVASLDRAFSPLRFQSMNGEGPLKGGLKYKVSVRGGEKASTVLTTQEFETVAKVEGAPKREETLEGVIKQCENFLAESRPGDAWMLWAELTADEKADERMQQLKVLILSELVG